MKIAEVLLPGMRKLFLFQFLFLGIVFFTFSVSDVFAATSCGVGGTCQATACSGTLIQEYAAPVCVSTSSEPNCCKPDPTGPATLTCPTDFESKNGLCFPKASVTGLSDMGGTAPVYTFLVRLMNWLLGILGILGVIAFVISGTQYLVSAGDEEMAKTAKQNMTYAVIGLVVALAGLIVVNAIAGLTGAGGVTNY